MSSLARRTSLLATLAAHFEFVVRKRNLAPGPWATPPAPRPSPFPLSAIFSKRLVCSYCILKALWRYKIFLSLLLCGLGLRLARRRTGGRGGGEEEGRGARPVQNS